MNDRLTKLVWRRLCGPSQSLEEKGEWVAAWAGLKLRLKPLTLGLWSFQSYVWRRQLKLREVWPLRSSDIGHLTFWGLWPLGASTSVWVNFRRWHVHGRAREKVFAITAAPLDPEHATEEPDCPFCGSAKETVERAMWEGRFPWR